MQVLVRGGLVMAHFVFQVGTRTICAITQELLLCHSALTIVKLPSLFFWLSVTNLVHLLSQIQFARLFSGMVKTTNFEGIKTS